MANEWYYAKDGQQLGPVSAKELKKLADAGQLQAGDLVWKEGMPDWKPAADVKGLVASAAPAAGEIVVTQPASASPRRGRRRHRSPIGQVLLIIASVLLIGQMCVPWWSMKLTDIKGDNKEDSNSEMTVQKLEEMARTLRTQAFRIRDREQRDQILKIAGCLRNMKWVLERPVAPKSVSEINAAIDCLETMRKLNKGKEESRSVQQLERYLKVAKKDFKWWRDHLSSSDQSLEARYKELEKQDETSMTFRIWGWNEGAGIMGLVFGIVVMVLSIVFISIPPLRNWSWIVSILATIFGIITLIFALIWIINAPGQDASPEFRQGIIIGPYLLLAGGVMFLLVGIFDMIAGLTFLSRLRRLKAQA